MLILVIGITITKGTHKNAVSIPMSIWDLDKCTHLNLRYEPDIDSRHPVSNSIDFNQYINRFENYIYIGFLRHGLSTTKTRDCGHCFQL